MMKNTLRIQKIAFICLSVSIILFFFATVFVATPFYRTFLYGNQEVADYFTGDFQQYNKKLFNYALVLVILMVVLILINPRKYYATYVSFPIIVIISAVCAILPLISIRETLLVVEFYYSYDFSSIERLADFKVNQFYLFWIYISSGVVAASSLFLTFTATLGFVKYVKRAGEVSV